MRRLKTIFACMLMAIFSVGQVWGADPTISWDFKTLQTTSGTQSGINWETGKTGSATATAYNSTYGLVLYGVTSGGGYFQTTSAISGTITNVNIVSTAKKNTPKYTVYCSTDGSTWDEIAAAQTAGTKDHAVTGSYTYVKVANTTAATAQLGVASITVTYTPSGDDPTPTVSADPEEVTNVVAEGVTDQTIALTYENITDYVTEVTVHPNADGTGTLSPAWLTASVSDADAYATLTYSVSANDGAARTAYIKVYTTDGDKEATKIIPVSQVKYSAPTGTFNLYSGDIAEGDYVIYYGGGAMNTTVTSNRLQYLSVTPSEDKIVNPDEAIIWHIAASGDYWTLYNAAVEKYAASTSSKNQATMAAGDLTDNMKWSITGSSTYEFENLARSTSSSDPGNKWLRKNGTYGFACYSSTQSGTGPLTLYKKQVEGQPATPTFSVAGGNYESAQSVEISCETVGATIYYTLDGTKPTSSSSVYSTALNISSTTTVKAVAIKNEIESTVASATYTIIVWQTVADVWNSITVDGPTNAHIYGYVSQTSVGGYDNNFYISDNGSTEGNQLYAYRMDMNSFSVAVGDKVKLAGDLTIHNEVKEFKYTSATDCGKVMDLVAKGALQSVAVSGTPTKTQYAANETFDPAGLKVMGTYANGFVGEITEGITWGNDLTDNKVTESTTVHVTATVSGITNDPAYDVPVTVAAKTLVSIAVGTDAYTIYTGEALPQPTVTATYSEGEPEDVSALAIYDSESVFNTATIDNPDPQTITVSYTFGGATQTTTYTVSVKDYANADNAPYTVTEALHIITAAIGNVESAREIVVAGTVSVEKVNDYKNRYKISDGVNELLVYNGKGFNSASFTDDNYPKVNDVVKVKGNVINFNNSTPEFASGKSYLLSQVRPASIAIEDVASFEVGAVDLAEGDLDITTPSDGDITFVSGDEATATIVANAIHAVAPGTVTITANLAATENVDELNYAAASTTFNVTVIAATVKYAISFDGNGNTGGSAPEAIADKAAGAEVTLPANTYTKTDKVFNGWKVINNTTSAEVEVTAGAFTMPSSAVTIQAQWTEIPVWAYTYTSNVTLSPEGGTSASAAKIKFYGEEGDGYDAIKAGTGSAQGAVVVNVPAGATALHFHAYGWNSESVGLTVTAPTGVTVSPATEISINSNSGIASNSPFTLAEGSTPMTDAYYVVELSGNTEETTLTFSATSGKRFVLFGVNQEGGVVPVLDHIAITGTMTNTTGWKTGDNITPAGLTVNAYYTLNEVMQDPVDVTSSVVWSHAALVEDQTEVTLTATFTDEVAKSANVNVTIEAVVSGDPEISTDVNSRSWTVDKDAAIPDAKTFAVTMKNIASATVTLGGDNPEAFSVSPATLTANGDITVSVVSTATVGSYTATITIKDDASETSKDVTVNLTVNVPETPETPVSTTSKWVAAEAEDLVDGKQVLITGVKDETTYAMGGQNNNNRAAVAASIDGEGVLTPGENTMAFTLVAQGEGTYALRTSNGKYLYAASSGSNHLKSQATVNDNAKWTLSVTSAVAESSSNRNVMQFNGGSSIFSCYASASQTAIKLYVPKEDWEELRAGATSGKYYTTCLSKKVVNFRGGVFWNMSKRGAGIAYLEEAAIEDLAAGKPFIFEVTGAKLEVVYEGAETSTALTNGALRGTFSAMDQSAIDAAATAESSDIYILYSNHLYKANVAGQNSTIPANRAYVVYNALQEDTPASAPGRRVKAMPMQPQEATGLDNIFDINADGAQKLILNGQLIIIREGKMYDTTGRVVK